MSADRLQQYRAKRDFKKTPEPQSGQPADKPRFCVQRHDATRLHYDFRLEAAGVLLSWAVPEGPSFDPSVKRLAVRTEDHPIDYLEFEGVIPKDEYGGGTVILWDLGVYENITEKNGKRIETSLAADHGHIKFVVLGEKLKGSFALTRMGGKDQKNWLMVKVNDPFADTAYDPVSSMPQSVRSGLVNADLLEGEHETWHSNR